MSKKESFLRFLEKNNLKAKIIDAKFPYNYNDNKAYLVTFKGLTQYFYFNSDGVLLARNIVK
jgi:hypothetical protein